MAVYYHQIKSVPVASLEIPCMLIVIICMPIGGWAIDCMSLLAFCTAPLDTKVASPQGGGF